MVQECDLHHVDTGDGEASVGHGLNAQAPKPLAGRKWFAAGIVPGMDEDELAVQVGGGDKDSGMLLTLGNMTPHQDFFNLFDPVRSGISMLTPYLKAPIEFSLDRDLFTGRKISDYPGDNS